MYLSKKFTLPYEDESRFAMGAEQQKERMRRAEGQDSPVSGSVTDCLCVPDVLCKCSEP